ncbi:hypothetical protein D6833_05030 [Candidatus Parcubacteria bacterium]|nr:MAG: hypothetical protein D6833_05030 [Candidatus Parcubacteria bacterium]
MAYCSSVAWFIEADSKEKLEKARHLIANHPSIPDDDAPAFQLMAERAVLEQMPGGKYRLRYFHSNLALNFEHDSVMGEIFDALEGQGMDGVYRRLGEGSSESLDMEVITLGDGDEMEIDYTIEILPDWPVPFLVMYSWDLPGSPTNAEASEFFWEMRELIKQKAKERFGKKAA